MNSDLAPQEKIENFIEQVVKLGNYEMAYLISQEGLTLAQSNSEGAVPEDRVIEMSVIFQDIQQMADVMGGISDIKELVLEGNNKKKIIFRFFNAFDQSVVLALVIPPQKSYKGLTNKLIKLIKKVSD